MSSNSSSSVWWIEMPQQVPRKKGFWLLLVSLNLLLLYLTMNSLHKSAPTTKATTSPVHTPQQERIIVKKHLLYSNDTITTINETNAMFRTLGSTKVKVIIYTMAGAGADVVGELLANHPSVYFMSGPFETVNDPFIMERMASYVASEGVEILKQLLNCDFVPYIKDIERFHSDDSGDPMIVWGRRVLSDILKGHHCASHRAVVIATTNQHNLNALVPLIQDGIKVIHLVRDPRAQVYQTLQNVSTAEERQLMISQTPEMCNILKQDLAASQSIYGKPSGIKDNYHLLRYEDLASDPSRVAQGLFRFIGLDMSASRMPDNLVNVSGSSNGTAENSTNNDVGLFLSTHNKVLDMSMSAWRQNIDLKLAQRVQTQCKTSMDLLSYAAVKDRNDLKARQKTLVLPFLNSIFALSGKIA